MTEHASEIQDTLHHALHADPVVELFLRVGMFVYQTTGERIIIKLQRADGSQKSLRPAWAVDNGEADGDVPPAIAGDESERDRLIQSRVQLYESGLER